jgi:hypothetical protein
MGTDISNILEPGEEIVWQGVISRALLGFSLIGFLIPIFLIGGFFLTQNIVGFGACNPYKSPNWCHGSTLNYYVNGSIVGYVIIGIGFAFLVVNFFWQFVQQYTITSKRVIIKSGLIGTHFRSIYYEQMKGLLKKSGWTGRMFGFGTVKIDTGRMNFFHKNWSTRETSIQWDYLTYIDKPDEVYQYINTAVAKAKGTPIQQNPQ